MGTVTSQAEPYVPNALLSRLVGFRLYSVQFVMDYVQLRFDGPTEDMPVLNCDMLPVTELAGRTVRPGEVGYADAHAHSFRGSSRQLLSRLCANLTA